MASETAEQQEIKILKKKLELYEELVSDIEYALDKVGSNNNRVEMAFETFQEAMNELNNENN